MELPNLENAKFFHYTKLVAPIPLNVQNLGLSQKSVRIIDIQICPNLPTIFLINLPPQKKKKVTCALLFFSLTNVQ